MPGTRSWVVLAGFIAVCLAVGGLGSLATSAAVVEWYPSLNKPTWNPPAGVFAPVWTVLYIVMAIAAWLVWRTGTESPGVRQALALFFIQLALNGIWSFIFFGARSPGWALVEIVVLLAILAVTAWVFFRYNRWAGILMLPYLAWVAFATLLNFEIWRLN